MAAQNVNSNLKNMFEQKIRMLVEFTIGFRIVKLSFLHMVRRIYSDCSTLGFGDKVTHLLNHISMYLNRPEPPLNQPLKCNVAKLVRTTGNEVPYVHPFLNSNKKRRPEPPHAVLV